MTNGSCIRKTMKNQRRARIEASLVQAFVNESDDQFNDNFLLVFLLYKKALVQTNEVLDSVSNVN